MHPTAGQRAVGKIVATDDAEVFEIAGFRIRPCWLVGEGELFFTDNARMGSMRAIEADAFPIDKIFPRPDRRDAHRVVFVKHPSIAFGNPAGTRIQAHSQTFLRDVSLLDLQGPKQGIAVILQKVLRLFFLGRLLLKLTHPAWQGGEVCVIDCGVNLVVLTLDKLLADVVDHIIFLSRGVLWHRHHLAVTFIQSLKHAVGISTVFQISEVETRGGGK